MRTGKRRTIREYGEVMRINGTINQRNDVTVVEVCEALSLTRNWVRIYLDKLGVTKSYVESTGAPKVVYHIANWIEVRYGKPK